jgi:hypothetical protein
MAEFCDSCGAEATHWRFNRDLCPTDRGTEVREYIESLCDDCAEESKLQARHN